MSVLPRDVLNVAHSLFEGQDDAHFRSCISRAYYSAYHACDNWVGGLSGAASQGQGPEGGYHQQLINRLKNPAPEVKCLATKKLSKMLGARLEVYKIQRVKSDYFLSEENTYEMWAKNCLPGVSKMLSEVSLNEAGVSSEVQPKSEVNLAALSHEPASTECALQVARGHTESTARPALKRIK